MLVGTFFLLGLSGPFSLRELNAIEFPPCVPREADEQASL